jgi:hypothetical protein
MIAVRLSSAGASGWMNEVGRREEGSTFTLSSYGLRRVLVQHNFKRDARAGSENEFDHATFGDPSSSCI